jgi:uncharacterized protein
MRIGGDFSLQRALTIGTLPPVVRAPEFAYDILSTYVGTYLKQEIQQETMIKDVAPFSRFLKVAAIMNGQLLNISSIARDAAVTRSTAERYFDILVDTLIGVQLSGWQPRLKVRERVTPKFFFFDPGIVRAITDRIRDPLTELEQGYLLETYLLHELRAFIAYRNIGGELYYWRTPAGREVDFIWERGDRVVALEVKSATAWRREYGKGLQDLLTLRKGVRCIGVYQGRVKLKEGQIEVFPVDQFLGELHEGKIIG